MFPRSFVWEARLIYSIAVCLIHVVLTSGACAVEQWERSPQPINGLLIVSDSGGAFYPKLTLTHSFPYRLHVDCENCLNGSGMYGKDLFGRLIKIILEDCSHLQQIEHDLLFHICSSLSWLNVNNINGCRLIRKSNTVSSTSPCWRRELVYWFIEKLYVERQRHKAVCPPPPPPTLFLHLSSPQSCIYTHRHSLFLSYGAS